MWRPLLTHAHLSEKEQGVLPAFALDSDWHPRDLNAKRQEMYKTPRAAGAASNHNSAFRVLFQPDICDENTQVSECESALPCSAHLYMPCNTHGLLFFLLFFFPNQPI